jgi:hypothetical protein
MAAVADFGKERNSLKQRRGVEGEFRIYDGLDWRTEFHRACVLDYTGKILRHCKVDR